MSPEHRKVTVTAPWLCSHHGRMEREFAIAIGPDEILAVQRFRYDVYVEEMGRYRWDADHDARVLIEPEDDRSWLTLGLQRV